MSFLYNELMVKWYAVNFHSYISALGHSVLHQVGHLQLGYLHNYITTWIGISVLSSIKNVNILIYIIKREFKLTAMNHEKHWFLRLCKGIAKDFISTVVPKILSSLITLARSNDQRVFLRINKLFIVRCLVHTMLMQHRLYLTSPLTPSKTLFSKGIFQVSAFSNRSFYVLNKHVRIFKTYIRNILLDLFSSSCFHSVKTYLDQCRNEQHAYKA